MEVWQTQHLNADEPGAISKTAEYVIAGRVVVLPTDTVYGVGCDAFSQTAIQKLYEIKQRPLHKSMPILIADFSDLPKIITHLPPSASPYLKKYWPGPLTVVLPKHPDLPDILSDDDTIAVRVPNHSVTRTLIRMAGGAMAVTSANISGQPPANSGAKAFTYLQGRVTVVLDAGPVPMGQPSTILDCTGNQPKVLREGLIKIS